MNLIDLIGKLPQHKTKRYKTRPLSAIASVAIHHSATKTGTPKAFATYHVNTKGWPGIAYAYCIGKGGQVYKCNPISAITYHVGDSNREAIGICLVGDFDHEKPGAVQLAAAAELVRLVISTFPKGLDLKRHHDYEGYGWKSCPGAFFPWEEFRKMCGK